MESLARSIERFVDGFANSSAAFDVPVRDSEPVARPSYLLKEDNYLDAVINNTVTKASLRYVADKYYSTSVDETLKSSTLVSASSYPSLHQILRKCEHSLSLCDMPEVYVTSKLRGINALSLEVKREKLILISREATVCLSEPELEFLLGHELGHHQQGNLVCHTVNGLLNSLNAKSEIFGPLISDTIEVPLKRWCRLSEFNADRAGLVCCKDINVVKQLFVKFGMIENPTAFNLYQETSEDHPLLSTRYNELKSFAQSYKNRLCL